MTQIQDFEVRNGRLIILEYEVLFLKLIQTVTNGTVVGISATGTELSFSPGAILGGSFTFDCGLERSIPYFLEALMCMLPLSKLPTRIVLTGITSDNYSASIDTIRSVNLSILKLFDSNLEVDVKVSIPFLFRRF